MRGPRDKGKVVVSSVASASPIAYKLLDVDNNYTYERVADQSEAQKGQDVSMPFTLHGGLAYSEYNPQTAGLVLAQTAAPITHEPNRIRAPLADTTVTLTGAANPVQYFFEATVNDSGADDGQPVLYCIAPEAAEINIYKISLDSGDFGTLLNTKTQSVTPTQPMGRPAEWSDGSNTYWRLGLGDTTNDFTSLTSIVSGTAADTWTSGTDADARHLQVVDNKLARSTGANEISLLSRATDPETEANWADEFFVGDVSTKITELGEASGFLYIGKEDGFYEWDTVGEAHNILPDIGRAPRNCQGMKYWHGGFLIPADSGLWWTRTGKPVGPDSNPFNLANQASLGVAAYFKHGRWMGLATFGEYVYGYYISSDGSNSYAVYGRERDEDVDPPGWGPIIWHIINMSSGDLNDFHGIFISETSEFSSSQTRPVLWIAAGNNLRYFFLDKDGAPQGRRGDIDLDAASSGVVSGAFDFGLPRVTKQLRVIEGWAEDFGSVVAAFRFSVYRDGGALENVGAAITADGFFSRFWTQDSNDTARSMLVRVGWSTTSNLTDSNGPHLRDVVIRAVALPNQTILHTFLIEATDNMKTSKKILSEIEVYVNDLLQYERPGGDTFNGVMRDVELITTGEEKGIPRYALRAVVREMISS